MVLSFFVWRADASSPDAVVDLLAAFRFLGGMLSSLTRPAEFRLSLLPCFPQTGRKPDQV